MSFYYLPYDNVDTALQVWAKAYALFTPQAPLAHEVQTVAENAQSVASNTTDVHLAPYGQSPTLGHDAYTLTSMSPKSFVFAPREELFSWEGKEKVFLQDALTKEQNTAQPRPKDILLFGVRPCDAYGLAYMHAFFAQEYTDMNYAHRQKALHVIAINCLEPAKQCFCASLGTGPFLTPATEGAKAGAKAGADLELTPWQQGFLVQVHSEKGQWLLTHISTLIHVHHDAHILEQKEALVEQSKNSFFRKPDFSTLQKSLQAGFNHEVWERVAPSCILCTGCTRVCPTCTCFTTHEENGVGDSGTRVRCWDSCQSQGFTRNAGWHEPRDHTSMVRYRMYDKLQYIEERFGHKGCTGCGRCSVVCPAAIDMVHITEELMQDCPPEAVYTPRPVPFVREQRGFDAKLYVPELVEIIDIFEEAKSIKRFTVKYTHNPMQGKPALRGQFYMITLFGVGEIAISVPFSDKEEHFFSFYVKKVGKVTTELFTKKVGDVLGLRGPFGVPFPYESFVGRTLLVVGSGVGHAPVRAPLIRAIENSHDFKNIIVIGSAMTYEELMLKEDLEQWNTLEGVQVHYALAKPTKAITTVPIHVGYINDLLAPLEQNPGLDWQNTSAIICASARRIKAVAKDLVALGMHPSTIYTALETNMRCGVGKCGHCKVGAHYICSDGPVFTYEQMLEFPPEF